MVARNKNAGQGFFSHPQMLRPRGCLSLHLFRPQRRLMSVFSSKRLENKIVLVTGASAGIGEVSRDRLHAYPEPVFNYIPRQLPFSLQRWSFLLLVDQFMVTPQPS